MAAAQKSIRRNARIAIVSDPIGPSDWDAGKNEANVEAWTRELWRQASGT